MSGNTALLATMVLCRRFALHDAGGLQRMGEGTFAGTRGKRQGCAESRHFLVHKGLLGCHEDKAIRRGTEPRRIVH